MCSHFVSKIQNPETRPYYVSTNQLNASFWIIWPVKRTPRRRKKQQAYVSLTLSIILSTCKHSYVIHRKTTALKLNALIQIQTDFFFFSKYSRAWNRRDKIHFSIRIVSVRKHSTSKMVETSNRSNRLACKELFDHAHFQITFRSK